MNSYQFNNKALLNKNTNTPNSLLSQIELYDYQTTLKRKWRFDFQHKLESSN